MDPAGRLDRERDAIDFDDGVTGLDDIADIEMKCLDSGIDYSLLSCLDGRSSLDQRSSRGDEAGPLLITRSESAEVLIGNYLQKLRRENLDLCADTAFRVGVVTVGRLNES
jgi:hypothetical protein